jgi:hypothetical protein
MVEVTGPPIRQSARRWSGHDRFGSVVSADGTKQQKNKRIKPGRLLSHVKIALFIALLGRRDSPTDAVWDYCRLLGGALKERGSDFALVRVPLIESGRAKSVSMLEGVERIEQMTGRKLNWVYHDQSRKGNHICYISDLRKLRGRCPNWRVTRSLDIKGDVPAHSR